MLIDYNPSDKENRPTLIWMSVIFVAIIWTGVDTPINFVFDSKLEEHNLWWDGIISSIFFLDIVLRINGRLKLPEPQSFDLNGIKINSKPYLKSPWFVLDVFSSLPFEIIMHLLGFSVPAKVISSLRLLRLSRIVKLRSLIPVVDFLPKWFKISLVFIGIMIALHWISCGWLLITPRNGPDAITQYNLALYWTVTTLTTVGYGDIVPHSNFSRLYTMGVMLIGVASYGVIIGNFSRMIMLADKYKEEKKERMTNLAQFMRYYNIPRTLQKEVVSFYNHLLEKNISEHDSQVITDLPQALQNELNIYRKIKLIKNVHIFQDCSIPCLKMIATKLDQTFHSPNEAIIRKGDEGAEMYIIGHGEVEINNGEKTVGQLKSGQFFGEIALLKDTKRTTDVISKSYCDLYTFKKEDFEHVIAKYPDLGLKFEEIYQKRRSDLSTNQSKNAA